MKMDPKREWKGYLLAIAALVVAFLFLSCKEAEAQEVVTLGEGENVTVQVDPTYVDTSHVTVFDTTFVTVIDTIPYPLPWECLPGWVCTPPVVEVPVDSVPPLPVSGVAVVITDGVALVSWNNRPNPDRGGVSTDGYYVASGNDTTGEPNPTDDVAGTPHSIDLKDPGRHYFCVTPHNVAGIPEGSCVPGLYELPLSAYLLSVAPEPYSISGVLDVVEGSYSVSLDRVDGSWQGLGDITLPSVDSVVFCSGGVCNREGRLPYELGGDNIDLTPGSYEVSWEVFGDEPDSGSATITVTALTGGVPIPNDSSDYAMGIACDWGDTRCTDDGVGGIDISATAGTTMEIWGIIEFPPNDRIFVSFQDEIIQVAQNERGWICVINGGATYPFPTIDWQWDSTDPTVASIDNGPTTEMPVSCP